MLEVRIELPTSDVDNSEMLLANEVGIEEPRAELEAEELELSASLLVMTEKVDWLLTAVGELALLSSATWLEEVAVLDEVIIVVENPTDEMERPESVVKPVAVSVDCPNRKNSCEYEYDSDA
jgi:hypothetical protein